MIPHERVNSVLKTVYRDGLARAKANLSEQVNVGDRVARKILSAIGLCEQGTKAAHRIELRRDMTPVELAGQMRLVLETRQIGLLADRLVGGLLDGSLTVDAAVDHLK